jgi:hypothetical protein
MVKLMRSVRARADRSTWTAERWHEHLLANAGSQAERSELNAIFARARAPLA